MLSCITYHNQFKTILNEHPNQTDEFYRGDIMTFHENNQIKKKHDKPK